MKAWRAALRQTAPRLEQAVAAVLAERWGGANIYLPRRIARMRWRTCRPRGAAERFAADLVLEIERQGGTSAEARAVLAALVGRRFVV